MGRCSMCWQVVEGSFSLGSHTRTWLAADVHIVGACLCCCPHHSLSVQPVWPHAVDDEPVRRACSMR